MSTVDSAKPARVTKRRAETRARLLDAAFAVFADKGFGQVRIDDVCAAAGYTRGAFYSQFDSLEELFFELYDQRASLIVDQVRAALVAVEDSADLDAFVDQLSSTLLLDRRWLLVKTDFLTHAARRPEVAARLLGHRAQLRAAIEFKLDNAGLPVPPEMGSIADAARAVVAAYDGVTVQLLLDGDQVAARRWLAGLIAQLGLSRR
ncbi:TetR/AcrR family transcriptional regulator [Nocardia caishijiensis]|uniref:TetR family transcriptional regulator n=1 Tax=Nocardia caishijiensis TaxID=184756 RepID=A0ABQ6YHD8_9NOCA|nr:TetR/AcrR family transcriptional regulator [Nocardia caishijiensis]KAF0845213.1 TetR family transcriptional regulator [Nocardia caishijiensis]